MRPTLTILLSFFSIAVFSQNFKPVGVANAYTLTEADGYPGSNYITGFEYAPDGKVYAKDFFGNLHITGNNFMRYVPGMDNISNNSNLKIGAYSEVWLIDENCNITIIKNDTLRERIAYPGKNAIYILTPISENRIVRAMDLSGKKLVVREFIHHQWKVKYAFPFNTSVQYVHYYVYLTKSGRLIVTGLLPSGNWQLFETDSSHSALRYVAEVSPTAYQNFLFGVYDETWKNIQPLFRILNEFTRHRLPEALPVTIRNYMEYFFGLFPATSLIFQYGNNLHEYLTIHQFNIDPQTVVFETKDRLNGVRINPAYPYLTVLTGNKPLRVFPYIKKYPGIYNNDNANNIFALAQDDKGRIWAGNYQNELSIVDDPLSPNQKHEIIRLKKQPHAFMNASLSYNGRIYLVGETGEGGLLSYDESGKMSRTLPQMPTAYSLYLAPKGQTVYYPSAGPGYPVYYCKAEELDKRLIHWNKLDSTAGIAPFGMTSITEDTLGRIWMGHPKKGFAVFDPATAKGRSYKTTGNETPIGFVSSTTDNMGTVWLGSDDKGLWYYNDYHKPPTPDNIQRLDHPLLNKIPRITSMSIFNDWLLLGCYDKICLLNLDSFYQKKKIILRYLNPQESNFTSFTEQNTILVSRKDSSVWFSTSDMLYRWDVKTWLHLPAYRVKVNTVLAYDSSRIPLHTGKPLELSPHVRSFDISFEYLSPDALPRYTRTALVRQGDSIIFSKPELESHFSYKSLNSGHYTFYLEIFEQDGSTSQYQYPFVISNYFWQHWWFWAIVTLLFLLPFALWLNTRRKQAIQQKEISQMNLVTLSSQFRPHFILNALNAIGADLKNNPGAESIISRLGESINLIFNYAQQRKVSHSLEDEWTLLENVIDIHKIIYLPELEVTIRNKELLDKYRHLHVPLGILEIHVENALIHGLRNKKIAPYNLSIEIRETGDNLDFTITDNGIGRREAKSIGSYKSNGVGTKNMESIISTLNKFNKNKIKISYTDLIEVGNHGTIVKITIPKKYYFKY